MDSRQNLLTPVSNDNPTVFMFPRRKSCSWRGSELRELSLLFDCRAPSSHWVGFHFLDNEHGRTEKVMLHIIGERAQNLLLSHAPDGQFILSDMRGNRLRVRQTLPEILNFFGDQQDAA